MAFVGLVPSEHSSGEHRRQGSITKVGNSHVRRLLVEAAWHARRRPKVGYELARRQRGQDAVVVERAWRCQQRLHQRWQRMAGRGKPQWPRSISKRAFCSGSTSATPPHVSDSQSHPTSRGGERARRPGQRRCSPAGGLCVRSLDAVRPGFVRSANGRPTNALRVDVASRSPYKKSSCTSWRYSRLLKSLRLP